MKILSIGNSFSQDAHRWLHSLSLCGTTEIDTVNLYIGGCTLETHAYNISTDAVAYEYEHNELLNVKSSSIKSALEEKEYDIITVQQASGYSGIPGSYIPYLTEVVDFVRSKQPDAKLYFHQTWSYEIDSAHGHFAFYNNDQCEMMRRICDCSDMASRLCGLEIIPAGSFIQYLRENVGEFNYKEGGLSLNRDGFHLSLDYGRFAVALLWYKTLTGETVDLERFCKENEGFKIDLLRTVDKALENFRKKI